MNPSDTLIVIVTTANVKFIFAIIDNNLDSGSTFRGRLRSASMKKQRCRNGTILLSNFAVKQCAIIMNCQSQVQTVFTEKFNLQSLFYNSETENLQFYGLNLLNSRYSVLTLFTQQNRISFFTPCASLTALDISGHISVLEPSTECTRKRAWHVSGCPS